MKLQNLTIIFIIIIIPIVLIFTLYLNLETKTILLQTSYDEKLIEATKEAVEALEINTTEWTSEKYAQLDNQKKDNIQSSINTFITSLSNKFGISGTSEELILNYVPAIVYVMYDGYYIYSPTYVPKTVNEEDKFSTEGEKIYKHVLKTFVPYSREYTANGKTYVINYTLDNYIRIYGDGVLREGYIIDDFGNSNKIKIVSNIIPEIEFNNIEIKPETLYENITVRDSYSSDVVIETYPYIYYRTGENSGDSGNIETSVNKAYYDEDQDEFFSVSDSYVKVYLGKKFEAGSSDAKYKKVLVCTDTNTGEYIELHQLINGNDDAWYYIDSGRQYVKYEKSDEINARIEKDEDCSAINYYIENYEFNKWLMSGSGLNLDEAQIKDLLDSKNEVIINNINNNLYLSMKNYSANSKNNYELPEITAVDWEQALSNISMIAFLQGNKIGLKTYNNYTVVSSTNNNEYVSDENLYYTSSQDYYYHTAYCNQISANDGSVIDGVYKNTEFKVQRYSYKLNDESKSGYYYRHSAENGSKTMAQCFNCIVNRNKFENDYDLTDEYQDAQYKAIARERYVLYQNRRLTKSSATNIDLFDIRCEEVNFDGRLYFYTFTVLNGNAPYKVNVDGAEYAFNETIYEDNVHQSDTRTFIFTDANNKKIIQFVISGNNIAKYIN